MVLAMEGTMASHSVQGVIPAALLMLAAATPASATVYASGTEGPGFQDVVLGDFGVAFPMGKKVYLDVGGASLLFADWNLTYHWTETWWDNPAYTGNLYLDGDDGVNYFDLGFNGHHFETFGNVLHDFQKLHYLGNTKTYGASLDIARFDGWGGKPTTGDNPYSVPFGIDCFLGTLGQSSVLYEFQATSGSGFSWTLSDVKPAGIPEPGSWMLLIGGLGLAGAVLRRRTAMAAPPP
jgi:hypothetical protein